MISEHASPLAAIGGVDAGGQNLHVAELATALVRQGHQVEVYTRRDDPRTPECVRAGAGYDVLHVPAGPAVALHKDELFGYMRPFGRWMASRWSGPEGPPDVVHAHFWMSGMAAVEATTRHPVPVVLTYHALGVVKRRYQRADDTSPPLRIPIESQLGRAVHRVIAQCRDEVAELSGMGVPLDNIDAVPSGVDVARFSPTGPAQPRAGRARVITVGRLVPRKGYDDLIRAVQPLDDVELVIVGGPPEGVAADPEGQRLAGLADRLGVADRVRLVGPIPAADMPAWYRSADLVACAPWYEPFGLTPLESMACGVPVVTYTVGGLRDTVLDGVTGLHVEPGDVAGLTGALHTLLADGPLRRRYGRAALERARTHYSWRATAARVADVYADVRAPRITGTDRMKVAS
jgi:glycosyltransferase involved in cell wall biosynthesis